MYELQTLESFQNASYIQIETLQAEQQRIETVFLHIIYSEISRDRIERYVRQHAAFLNKLLNQEELKDRETPLKIITHPGSFIK